MSDLRKRSMRELAAIVLGDELARARAETRTRRLRTATSRHWVAGYPRLLAEWHPNHVWCVAPHGSWI